MRPTSTSHQTPRTSHSLWGGGCKSCQKQQVPCIFGRSRSSCNNYGQQESQCSGPITQIDMTTITERPCPRCEKLLSVSRYRMSLHEAHCRGRCRRCRDLGLACIKSSKGCEACTQAGVRCGGGLTHKDMVIAGRLKPNTTKGKEAKAKVKAKAIARRA